jgi:hypothetical protein
MASSPTEYTVFLNKLVQPAVLLKSTATHQVHDILHQHATGQLASPAAAYRSQFVRAAHADRTVYSPETLPLDTGRPRLVVLGTGWAAARLCRDIDPHLYDLTVQQTHCQISAAASRSNLDNFHSWLALGCLPAVPGVSNSF